MEAMPVHEIKKPTADLALLHCYDIWSRLDALLWQRINKKRESPQEPRVIYAVKPIVTKYLCAKFGERNFTKFQEKW